MELRLLDLNFKQIEVVDVFESLIWTDRYYEAGDFELHLPLSHIPDNLGLGAYITYDKSDSIMIAESIQLDRSGDNGNEITVSGRSLESILDRRIVEEKVIFSETRKISEVLITLVNECIVNPSNSNRKIDKFVFDKSKLPDAVNAELSTIGISSAQYRGNVLYEAICNICRQCKLGWKVRINADKNMELIFYGGKDRSKTVIFSEKMGNLSDIQYLVSTKDYKNAAFISGGEDDIYATIGTSSGLDRREVAVSCSSSRSDGDSTLSESQYKQLLENEGRKELANRDLTGTSNGSVDTSEYQFVYGRDFNLGDIVTIDYGFTKSTNSRVVENTYAVDVNGFQQYNSFENVG